MSTIGEPSVAVVGATGAVGNEIVELIAARGFPHSRLTLFASQSGAAGTLETEQDEYLVEALHDAEDLAAFDVAFLAVPEGVAADITRAAPGPLLIDLSGAARNPSSSVPMVAPGVTTRAQIAQLSSARTFTIPHPAAHVLTLCLDALQPSMATAFVLTGASAGGRGAIARLVDQTTDLLSARLDLEEEEVQRAFNAFSRESERALAERIAAQAAALRAAAALSSLAVQLVSIPVLHGTGLMVSARLEASGGQWLETLRAMPGVLLIEEGQPLSIIDALGQEAIQISAEENRAGVDLWCAFDNTRLAALTAVWIAETFAIRTPVAN
jgi:aspartate-semialdehyde dehydrogenase